MRLFTIKIDFLRAVAPIGIETTLETYTNRSIYESCRQGSEKTLETQLNVAMAHIFVSIRYCLSLRISPKCVAMFEINVFIIQAKVRVMSISLLIWFCSFIIIIITSFINSCYWWMLKTLYMQILWLKYLTSMFIFLHDLLRSAT